MNKDFSNHFFFLTKNMDYIFNVSQWLHAFREKHFFLMERIVHVCNVLAY